MKLSVRIAILKAFYKNISEDLESEFRQFSDIGLFTCNHLYFAIQEQDTVDEAIRLCNIYEAMYNRVFNGNHVFSARTSKPKRIYHRIKNIAKFSILFLFNRL